jgi:hypothetical protein
MNLGTDAGHCSRLLYLDVSLDVQHGLPLIYSASDLGPGRLDAGSTIWHEHSWYLVIAE